MQLSDIIDMAFKAAQRKVSEGMGQSYPKFRAEILPKVLPKAREANAHVFVWWFDELVSVSPDGQIHSWGNFANYQLADDYLIKTIIPQIGYALGYFGNGAPRFASYGTPNVDQRKPADVQRISETKTSSGILAAGGSNAVLAIAGIALLFFVARRR